MFVCAAASHWLNDVKCHCLACRKPALGIYCRRLGRFCVMDENGQLAQTELQSPLQRMMGLTFIACLLVLLTVYALTRRWVEQLGVWWCELMVYACLPVLVTFTILYHSHAREGMSRPARFSYLFFVSALIFASVIFCVTVFWFLSNTVLANFATGH